MSKFIEVTNETGEKVCININSIESFYEPENKEKIRYHKNFNTIIVLTTSDDVVFYVKEDVKTIKKMIEYISVDFFKIKDISFVGIEDNGDRKGVNFYKLKDEKPCSICGKLTDIEYLEFNWDSAGCNTRICVDCLRAKF